MKNISILLIIVVVSSVIFSSCKGDIGTEQSKDNESSAEISSEDKKLSYFDVEIASVGQPMASYKFPNADMEGWEEYKKGSDIKEDVYRIKCLSVDYSYNVYSSDDPQNTFTGRYQPITRTKMQITEVLEKIHDYGYKENDIITAKMFQYVQINENDDAIKDFFIKRGGTWGKLENGYNHVNIADGEYPYFLSNEHKYSLFVFGHDIPMEPGKEYIVAYGEYEDGENVTEINRRYVFIVVPLENRNYREIKGYEEIRLHPYVIRLMQDLYDLYANK